MNSFSKDSLISFFTGILIFIFGFFSIIIISRVLGPGGRGVYSLIILIPGLILTFGNLGLGAGNVYFVGSKKYKTGDVISNSLVLAILVGFILILVFWGLLQLDPFQKFIINNRISPFYLWMVVLVMPLSLLLSFFQDIIRGKGDITNYNWTRIFQGFIELLAIIFFVLILKKNIFGAVLSNVIAIVGTAFFAIFLVKRIGKLYILLNKKLLKDSISYGGRIYLANTASFLSYRLDMFMIAWLLSPEISVAAVGFYSIAVAMAEKLFMIPGAFATVLLPKVSSSKSEEADNLTPKVVRHTILIVFICSLVLAFLAKPLIIILFGSAFLPSVAPLIILLPGIIAFSIGGVLAADLSGRGKPQFAVYSSIACIAVNFPLNLFLIPIWGISGAAFASTIAYIADTLIILWAFLRISKKSLSEVLFIRDQDLKDYAQVVSSSKDWIRRNLRK